MKKINKSPSPPVPYSPSLPAPSSHKDTTPKNYMKPQISNLIKVTSLVAISAALTLESWNLYLQLQDKSLPDNLNPVLWLATIALIVHGIEGAIAAFKASAQNKNPLTYGIYTFFVGTIGLKELSSN